MINLNDTSDFSQYLMDRGVDFVEVITNNTTHITVLNEDGTKGKSYLISDGGIEPKYLSFIKAVKKYATENEFIEPRPERAENVSYFKWSKNIDGVYLDCNEIDVKGAYWRIAHELGYISNGLYEKGLTVPKNIRLAALGSFATVKHRYTHRGGETFFEPPITNEKTRGLFFHVAKVLDDIMIKISKENPNDFLFYWVDAFFVKRNAARKIMEALKQNGLEYRIKNCPKITAKRLDSGHTEINVLEAEKYQADRTDIRFKKFSMPAKSKQTMEHFQKIFDSNFEKINFAKK